MDLGFEGAAAAAAAAQRNKMKQISHDRSGIHVAAANLRERGGAVGGSMLSAAAPPPSSSTATVPRTPCAAYKFLRRKCTLECIFAPYFPPDDPNKFVIVHKIFGASNVSKLLAAVDPQQRQVAADSLSYEAKMRDDYPAAGCCGYIQHLCDRLKFIQGNIVVARMKLAAVVAEYQHLQAPFGAPAVVAAPSPMGMGLGLGIPGADAQSMIRDHYHYHHQQQQIADAEMQQKIAMAAVFVREHQQQEFMIRGFHQQQPQQQQHEFGFVHDVVANDDYDALSSVSELNTPALMPAAVAANPIEDPFGAHQQQHHQQI